MEYKDIMTKARWIKGNMHRITKRLNAYITVQGGGESMGLYHSMQWNTYCTDTQFVDKMYYMGKSLDEAMDQGQREIGSSKQEWLQMVDIFKQRTK